MDASSNAANGARRRESRLTESEQQDFVVAKNLMTGHEHVYGPGVTPQQAVVNAFEQYDRHNFNTWDYDYSQAKLTRSGLHAYCGDWMAAMPSTPEQRRAWIDKMQGADQDCAGVDAAA